MADPKTLYKLMILYLLRKVNFPLSNPQVWTFFEEYGYTTYFTFQETMDSLQEANLVTSEAVRNILYYDLSPEGEDALKYFQDQISDAAKQDMDEYIEKNRFRLRNETGVIADYYKTGNSDYTVHLKVREGKNVIFEVKLCVPGEEQAKNAALRLENSAQELYSHIVRTLL